MVNKPLLNPWGRPFIDSHEEKNNLPRTNMEPENWRISKGNDRIPTIHFQVRAVSFREGISLMFAVVSGHREKEGKYSDIRPKGSERTPQKKTQIIRH